MGLHICPYILKERVEEQGGKYFETETFEPFDHLRYSGDKDFVTTRDFEWIVEVDNPDGQSFGELGHDYIRPKDIDAAITWVKKNVYEGNQHRLINLLEEMRKNDRLYIYCSW